MAKGPKRKGNKKTRVEYRNWRKLINKDRKKAKDAKLKKFYLERNEICKEQKVGKSEARRILRKRYKEKLGDTPSK